MKARFLQLVLLRSVRRAFLGLALAGAGVASGVLLRPTPGHACSCLHPTWRVRLSAIESTPDSADHGQYWAAEGYLSDTSISYVLRLPATDGDVLLGATHE